jgi:hypothetical protein
MDSELTNETIRLGFVRHRGRWACRGAGGIWWLAARAPVKVFELARGTCCVVGCDGEAHFADPEDLSRRDDALVATHRIEVDGIVWRATARWTLADDRLRWRYEFCPSSAPPGTHLLAVEFNALPDRWRTLTFPTGIGLFDGAAFAVFPVRQRPWWMRLGDECLHLNVHYPITYKPTLRSHGAEPIVLEGFVRVGRLSPEQLAAELRRELEPANEPRRDLADVRAAALEALRRSHAAARATGCFADGEGAFCDLVTPAGWQHQGSPTTFGVGFSCGFAGHAIAPLLDHARRHEAGEFEAMARRLAHWIASEAVQYPYGGYPGLCDVAAGERFDFMGEDVVYPHVTARVAQNVLAAAAHFGDERLGASGLRACDWLRSILAADGSMPWKLAGTTGAPDGHPPAQAAPVAMAAGAWAHAHRLTGDDSYLAAADGLIEWIDAQFIERAHFGGYITDDHPGNGFARWETPSVTPSTYVIDALLDLHAARPADRYVDAARRTAFVQLLWQWLWNPPGLGRRIAGSAQQAAVWEYTLKQTLGGENLYTTVNYLRLHEVTGEALWLDAARLGLFRAEDDQFDDPADARYGALSEGWNLNEDCDISTFEGVHANLLGVSYLVHAIDLHEGT